MESRIPKGQKCEVCNLLDADVLTELKIDLAQEDSAHVELWYACEPCSYEFRRV